MPVSVCKSMLVYCAAC